MRLLRVIDDKLPTWGAPRVEAFAERARDELQKVSTFTGQISELVELFKPFTTDHDISFRCDNIRALWARVTPADQDRLLWAPHLVDWRAYWIDTHFPGLQKWTFDQLDEEFGAEAEDGLHVQGAGRAVRGDDQAARQPPRAAAVAEARR